QALDGNPDCAAALYNLNTALRMAGQPREAIALSWRWIRERLPAGTPSYASAVSLETLAAASSSNSEDGANPHPSARMVCVEDCSAEGSAAKEQDADGASCVTVVCIRWGPKYGPEYWRGWWHKAFLFSRETTLAGRVVYMDLDTVIAGSLDEIAGYAGPFAVLSAEGMANERRPGGLNSSVMSWDAGREVNTVQPVHDLLK
ncbi:unnamed protein product, partial [Ectocarpus sp. 8 AP-2014]